MSRRRPRLTPDIIVVAVPSPYYWPARGAATRAAAKYTIPPRIAMVAGGDVVSVRVLPSDNAISMLFAGQGPEDMEAAIRAAVEAGIAEHDRDCPPVRGAMIAIGGAVVMPDDELPAVEVGILLPPPVVAAPVVAPVVAPVADADTVLADLLRVVK